MRWSYWLPGNHVIVNNFTLILCQLTADNKINDKNYTIQMVP